MSKPLAARPSKLRGFTLVELLVVIAIIGILVSLLLPAVQSAREMARRIQCSTNLKNWGLALTQYESGFGKYPAGVTRGQQATVRSDGTAGPGGVYRRQTFVVALWPHLELTTLADKYDYDYSFYATVNREAVLAQSDVYFCPSDRSGFWKGDQYHRSRGNYVVNWGNTDYYQDSTNYLQSPFGRNRWTRHADIKDGLSQTLFMSEVVQCLEDEHFDFRGDFLNDDISCAQFMTFNPPNTGVDQTICVNLEQPSSCLRTQNEARVSARSNHPGGVLALLGGDSVRFVSEAIDLETWQALSSMRGNEIAANY